MFKSNFLNFQGGQRSILQLMKRPLVRITYKLNKIRTYNLKSSFGKIRKLSNVLFRMFEEQSLGGQGIVETGCYEMFVMFPVGFIDLTKYHPAMVEYKPSFITEGGIISLHRLLFWI